MFKRTQDYTIRDGHGNPVQVNLRRDKRLKKTSRWERLPDGSILVRVPYRFPRHQINPLLGQISQQIDKVETFNARHKDMDLQQRAEFLNRKYFNGSLHWNSIRWVGNMQTRLGSCSKGGPTDGHIRISDKIKAWPDWVIDYVVAHEMMHRRHPNHSEAFWNDLREAYPLTERARGFIYGASFVSGNSMEDDQVNPQPAPPTVTNHPDAPGMDFATH